MAASEDQNRSGIDEMQDNELEQYGVWVKAGPEDVDESEAEDEAFALADLEDEELGDASDILSVDEGLDEGSVDLGEELELESLDLDEDILEGGAAGDAGAFEVEFEETANVSLEEPQEDEDVFEEDLLTLEDDDVTLDLADDTEELGVETVVDLSEPEPLAAEPIDLPSEDDDEPTGVVDELELSGTDAPSDDDVTGISIEDDLPGDLDDLTLDLDSLDVDAYDETSAVPTEVPDDLDELDLTMPEEPKAPEQDQTPLEQTDEDDAAVAELDLSTLPDDDDDFDALDDAQLGQTAEDDLPELELDDELSIEDDLTTGFDDVSAVEDEMTTEWPAESATEPAAAQHGDGGSQALLASIERELSSIRTELADLKSELSHLRSAPAAARSAPAVEAADDDEAAGGFFEDEGDDDETIALTGAELDNIMNTAEFTEETGKPTNYEEESSSTQPVQEITLEDAPEEAGDLEIDLSAFGDEASPPGDTGSEIDLDESLTLAGSDNEVESLAGMDIDAELADIDELEDTSTPAEESAVASSEESDVFDAEPFESEALDAEPIDLDLEEHIESGDESEGTSVDEPLLDETPTLEIGTAADLNLPEGDAPIPENLKGELRSVLNYMDKLLDSLPEEKIQEFAASEHFKVYKRLFEELGLEQ